jgi:hypothetical protein
MLLIPFIFLVGSDSGLAVARESGGIAFRLMWINSNDLDSKRCLPWMALEPIRLGDYLLLLSGAAIEM